jgi:hypothetical protein
VVEVEPAGGQGEELIPDGGHHPSRHVISEPAQRDPRPTLRGYGGMTIRAFVSMLPA